jgi:hypothetical protein
VAKARTTPKAMPAARSGMRTAAAFGVGLAILLAACSGSTNATPDQTNLPSPFASATVEPTPTPEPTPEPTPDLTAYTTCQDLVGPLLEALGELDSRLDIGLNYSEYGDKVADANVQYDRIDIDQLRENLDCLSGVAVPLEDALNFYSAAYRVWDNCFDRPSCTNEQITPNLQRKWARAAKKVDAARNCSVVPA